MPKTRTKTHILKKSMLEALEKSLGVVTTACKSVGIERRRHYDWLEKDPEYAKQVAELKEIALDFAESKLHEQIEDGNTTATIFFLKTQGKKRGYIEKTQHEVSGKVETDLSKLSLEELLKRRDALDNE